MDYADKAEQLFKNGLNCAQAVSGAFSDLYPGISREIALNLASPFGGGFARKRQLCGAVSGMGIVYGMTLGTHTVDEKMDTYEKSARMTDLFAERYGSIICSELLEKTPEDTLTPRESALSEQDKQAYHWPCIDYVRGAAQLAEQYLSGLGIIK